MAGMFRRNGAERRNPEKPGFCGCTAKSRPKSYTQKADIQLYAALLSRENNILMFNNMLRQDIDFVKPITSRFCYNLLNGF